MTGLDAELSRYAIQFGIGGALALLMFYLLRKSEERYQQLLALHTEMWKSNAEKLMSVVQENTAANAKNYESNMRIVGLIETMERNNVRKTDLASVLLNQKAG